MALHKQSDDTKRATASTSIGSSNTTHGDDGSVVNASRPNIDLPDRNPSASSRVSSTNWIADGEHTGISSSISPSAVFGDGVDTVPMPLEASLFAPDSNETLAFLDTMDGNETNDNTSSSDRHPDSHVGAPTICNTEKVDNHDTCASANTRKRKAYSVGKSISVADFLQNPDPAATYNAYQPSSEPCEPNDIDILMGRGGLSNHHIGNVMYRNHIEDFKPYYQRLETKDEKKELSQAFVNYVHNYGGRFLEHDEDKDGWVEVESNKARKKCSQALREEKKPRTSR